VLGKGAFGTVYAVTSRGREPHGVALSRIFSAAGHTAPARLVPERVALAVKVLEPGALSRTELKPSRSRGRPRVAHVHLPAATAGHGARSVARACAMAAPLSAAL
jgi:hypothetical protein